MTQIIEDKKAHVAEISRRLKKLYPDAHVELDYSNPFELMSASILAAQNTDVNINKLTPILFRKYRGPEDYLKVPPSELEQDLTSRAFSVKRQKASRRSASAWSRILAVSCRERWPRC